MFCARVYCTRIRIKPQTMRQAATTRIVRNGSLSTTTAIAAPKSTLVSRKAATIAIGAAVIAQIAIPYERTCSAPPASPRTPVEVHCRNHVTAIAVKRIGHHHHRNSQKKPDGISVGVNGGPRTYPVDDRIGADRNCCEKRKANGPAVDDGKIAGASRRQQKHPSD